MPENQDTTEERFARARSHLTPELRREFDAVDPAAVQFNVMHERYSFPRGKHDAALAWLAEKREARERREAWRFRVILGVATATLIVTVLTYCRG